MGRGSSGGRGSVGAGGKQLMTLEVGEDVIDLTNSPLTYGQKDAALTGEARKAVEAFEDKRWKNKIEYSQLIKNDGTVVESNKGGKGSVASSIWAHNQADVLTHNHPREPGVIGGTFSPGDLNNFSKFKQTTYRATAKEGTYSISKGTNFDSKLAGAYNLFAKKNAADLSAKAKDLTKSFKDKKITYEQYRKSYRGLVNENLVNYHNWLLSNQKTYGYTYTLEGRATK